jgi:hypothetical protein
MRIRAKGKWLLRKIFRPKKNKVISDWRKLHKEELHKLYCSPSVMMSRLRR